MFFGGGGATTYFSPNPSLSQYPSSPNVARQYGVSHSFSNLLLADLPPGCGSTAIAVDDISEHCSKRLVGSTLAGRVVRASVKSVTAAAQLPMYLSP